MDWDTSDYPGGVYFYRMAIHSDKLITVPDGRQADDSESSSGQDFVDVKKMVLLK